MVIGRHPDDRPVSLRDEDIVDAPVMPGLGDIEPVPLLGEPLGCGRPRWTDVKGVIVGREREERRDGTAEFYR